MAKITRWNPQTSLHSPRQFDKMFDELWNSMWASDAPARYHSETRQPVLRPTMDVVEEEHRVLIHVDLPGVAPDDVRIEVDGDRLTISGEIAAPEVNEEADGRCTYRERHSGAFKRTLRLADTLDTANAAASFAHGVLTLELPKLPEAQPKRITVQTAE